jgi:hypothetical protein
VKQQARAARWQAAGQCQLAVDGLIVVIMMLASMG